MSFSVGIIDSDAKEASQIGRQIGHYGYTVRIFETPRELEELEAEKIPRALLINLDREWSGTEERLRTFPGEPPLLFFTSEGNDVNTRLRALRRGGSAYFQRPLDMDALIGKLEEASAPPEERAASVIIVEEDPAFAGELAGELNDGGVLSKVVFHLPLLMESLVEFNADLILMNLYFSDILGMEVAAALRQQKAFESLPIIFYSSETNPERRMAALKKGGDDHLQMPLAAEALKKTILSRAIRSRHLRGLIVRDSLTGLFNHTRFQEMLRRELIAAGRKKTEICLVKADLDSFKKINDERGHQAGDRVIKSLARLLRQRAWPGDVIGRYSGAEFAVIVKSLDPLTAGRVFDEIRRDFSMLRHRWDGQEFNASFSCGISCFSRYPDQASLIDAADRAVLTARARGGNRTAVILPEKGGNA